MTIAVDEEVLRKARIVALERGTSLSVVIRSWLEAYAEVGPGQLQAAKAILEISESYEAGSGGMRWTRDELHERQPAFFLG